MMLHFRVGSRHFLLAVCLMLLFHDIVSAQVGSNEYRQLTYCFFLLNEILLLLQQLLLFKCLIFHRPIQVRSDPLKIYQKRKFGEC